jgi:hypothetical protein
MDFDLDALRVPESTNERLQQAQAREIIKRIRDI